MGAQGPVALGVPRREDEEFIHMFQDEARISAQLIHPNLCQSYEFDQIEGAWYIAMEYLRGEDVRRLWKAASLKGLTLPEARATRPAVSFAGCSSRTTRTRGSRR